MRRGRTPSPRASGSRTAGPYRAEYRKFKVKTVEGIDDFASMNEVVTRYFTRRIEEEKPFPDLVVIDGGKGQLNAAHAALSKLGLAEMPLISLAKREEEIFVLGRSESLKLPRRSPALRVLQQARDEAHRFAITFQRKRRAARTITSELMRIPGVGEAKRRQLLAAFGSLQGVREASIEAIAALPGFGEKSAVRIAELLRANSPTAPSRPAAGQSNANEAAGVDAPPTDELIAPVAPESTAPTPELVQLELSRAPSSQPDAISPASPSSPITPLPEHP